MGIMVTVNTKTNINFNYFKMVSPAHVPPNTELSISLHIKRVRITPQRGRFGCG